jgi:dihydrofolate reductase
VLRDPLGELPALKARHGGEVQVHGSAGLARALLTTDQADELRLLTFPVVLGRGKRLFGEDAAPMGLSLVESKVSGTGVIMARYRRAGEVKVQAAPPPV